MAKRICLAVSLALVVVGCHREQPASRTYAGAPVVIISIDTLRADHLPAYGYRKVETPAIDALRRDSILFANAYSHVPLTLPSHVSMLTGELPPDNGVRNNIGYPFDAHAHETIPSILKRHGYATGAAVSAYVLRGTSGLKEAFDFYDDAMESRPGEPEGEVQRGGGVTAGIAKRWIGERGAAPFFFLLHIYEPHAPYAPPEPFRSRYAASPYDGEIAAADAIVGDFIGELKARGVYDRAIVVLMSDHGEGLGDHGESEHGIFLYREDLHVPLLLKLPQQTMANRTVERPAALIDLFPTVAALTGVDAPKRSGTSLLELDRTAPRSIYAESLYPRIHLGWSDLRSLIGERLHFIQAPAPELYDIARDAAEKTNIVTSERRATAQLRSELEKYGTSVAAPSNIDPEEAKKLAALGYLSASTTPASGPLPDPKDHIAELELLGDANRREAAGDHAGAIAEFRTVLQKNPRLTDAWSFLARAQEHSGAPADAIDSYKRAIQLAPSLAGENALSVASLALQLRRIDEAAAHAELAMRAHPADAHVILGRVALAHHDNLEAEREGRAALAADTSSASAKILLAQVLAEQKRFGEAMTLLDSVEREGHGTRAQFLDFVRGDILGRQNRVDEAEAAFRREITAFPQERQAYASAAALYWFAGRRAESKAMMEAMLRANPDSREFAVATLDGVGASELAAEFRRR